MANATNYLKDKLYDHVYRGIAYTPPTSVRLALYTTATDDDGGGTEVTGGSYTPQTVTASAPTDGAGDNTAAITWPNMPDTTATPVTHWATLDQADNMLTHDAFSSPISSVNAGDDLVLPIGDFDLAVT